MACGEPLDHVLFFGPPGLGKTTLAQIVAREMGVGFRATSGPVIAKSGDLAALLTNLEARDVLFIDEIHRLSRLSRSPLSGDGGPALDLIIGEGPSARSVQIDLAPFTLVGATTRAGLLTKPLRDRFGIPVRLNFYTEPSSNRSWRAAPACSAWPSRTAPTRSRGARAARRASPAGCCGGCATSPMSRCGGVDRASPPRADPARGRRAGPDAMDRRYLK